jgi:hypothetical protein
MYCQCVKTASEKKSSCPTILVHGQATWFPLLCKWNAFAIDSLKALCEHEESARENFFLLAESETHT